MAGRLRPAPGNLPLAALPEARGLTEAAVRDEVRAAFVFNIARFVYWPRSGPPTGEKRLRLCLYRENPLGAAASSLTGKQLHGRQLALEVIDNLVSGGTCQILLIPGRQLARFQREAPAADLSQTLTITDLSKNPSLLPDASGVMVSLVRKETTLGFAINRHAVAASDLRVSSELLKLAVNRETLP